MKKAFGIKAGWLEVFVLILFLLNGLLLLPGTQSLRFLIRALPYVASLGSLLLIRTRKHSPLPPGGFLLQGVLFLLILNLLHPGAQLRSGIAQVVFQLAIISPIFWAGSLIEDDARLTRLLWLVFGCNAVGAIVGVLQIYFPDQFLPAEFSANASANYLSSLTFISPSGRILVRPPGLSDLPGGAAMSGSLAAVLGFAFSSLRSTGWTTRVICFGVALSGISVLYLTQCRSLTLMTVLAMLLLGFFGLQQSKIWNRSWMAIAGVAVVAGSFTWAVAVGGDKVRDRFLNMADSGLVDSYQTSRGWFWEYTFGEALSKYPLGAGPGRWGMMNIYFGEADRPDSPALWAEIQPTGWLYDGGVPMWLLYGTSLLTSMLFLFRVARSTRYGSTVPFAAALIFCINANIIGAAFSGPTFNTTMGLQYWLLLALLCGAARKAWQGPNPRQMRFEYLRQPARLPVPAGI